MRKKISAPSGYQWVIFAVCFFWEMIFMSLTLADSVYVVPVTTALGFTRTQFTMVFSIRSIVQLAGNLLYGKLYSRFHTKPLMVVGSACMVLGYLLYSRSTALWMFYLAAGIVGIATSLMAASSMTVILNSWFDQSAGLVFGLVFTGSSIGGSVLSAVMGKVIARVGYANSYRLTALLALLSALPVLLLAYERRNGPVSRETAGAGAAELPFRDFLRQRIVQAGLILCFVIGLTIYPVEASISAHLTDRGFSAEFAAGILGAALLFSALGKVLLGVLYDRFGLAAAVAAGTGCFVLGAALFIRMDQVWQVYVFAPIFGLAIANITTLSPFLTKCILSGENFGRYIGVFTAVTAAGNTVGFAVMSGCFDRFGTYTGIVLVQILIYLGATLLFLQCWNHRKITQSAGNEGYHDCAKNSED